MPRKCYLSLRVNAWRRSTEECQSGRMEHTANVLNPKGFRGFESLLLRKNNEPDARASGNYIFAGRRRDSKAGGMGPVSRRDAEAGSWNFCMRRHAEISLTESSGKFEHCCGRDSKPRRIFSARFHEQKIRGAVRERETFLERKARPKTPRFWDESSSATTQQKANAFCWFDVVRRTRDSNSRRILIITNCL